MEFETNRVGRKPIFLKCGENVKEIRKIDHVEMGKHEDWYQKRVSEFPELLLADEINSSFRDPVSIGTEILTKNGNSIDNLFVTEEGGIILAECKLIGNSDYRKVIAQVIDYAQDMTTWSFDYLDSAFRKKHKDKNLIEYVNERYYGRIDKFKFEESVKKNLETANFLILIISDHIVHDIELMAKFLNQYTTMNFQIGLIEIEVYKTEEGDWFVVPYITAKTKIIEKTYICVLNQKGEPIAIEPQATAKVMFEEASSKKIRTLTKKKLMLSDEVLFNAIERNSSTDIKDTVMEIIDDIRNNQITGYYIQRAPSSFGIFLQTPKMKQPMKPLTIEVCYAETKQECIGVRFESGRFYRGLINNGINLEPAKMITEEYMKFLNNSIDLSGDTDISEKTLKPLINNKVLLFAELRKLEKRIEDALQ